MKCVGVYFGTFSPITENHVAIIKNSFRYLDALWIAINPENPSKTNSLPLDVRRDAVRTRLRQHDISRLKVFLFDTKGLNLDWLGRGEVCKQVCRLASRSSPQFVDIVQIMGSDSFSTRGCQEALAQPEILQNLKRKLMVFMREGDGPLIIPGHLAGIVWVPPYKDRQKVSSTFVRSTMQQNGVPDVRHLHPEVYHIVKKGFGKKRKYSEMTEGPPTILLSGGPGSGKTSLLHALVKRFGRCWGASVGEMFRMGRALNLPMWPWPGLDPASQHWQYFEDISAATIQELVEPYKHHPIILDGISLETPEKVEIYTNRKVTHVIHIDCSKDLLIYRMALRGRAGETTPEQRETRASKYMKRQWARDKKCAHSPPFEYLVLKGSMSTEDMTERIMAEFGFHVSRSESSEQQTVAAEEKISLTMQKVSDEIQEQINLKPAILSPQPLREPCLPQRVYEALGVDMSSLSPDYRPPRSPSYSPNPSPPQDKAEEDEDELFK